MKTDAATKMLAALAHEGRLTLFKRLIRAGADGENAGDLARFGKVNFTTASAQLLLLENAGLIRSKRKGRFVNYTARYDKVDGLLSFLMVDCCAKRPENCRAALASFSS